MRGGDAVDSRLRGNDGRQSLIVVGDSVDSRLRGNDGNQSLNDNGERGALAP